MLLPRDPPERKPQPQLPLSALDGCVSTSPPPAPPETAAAAAAAATATSVVAASRTTPPGLGELAWRLSRSEQDALRVALVRSLELLVPPALAALLLQALALEPAHSRPANGEVSTRSDTLAAAAATAATMLPEAWGTAWDTAWPPSDGAAGGSGGCSWHAPAAPCCQSSSRVRRSRRGGATASPWACGGDAATLSLRALLPRCSSVTDVRAQANWHRARLQLHCLIRSTTSTVISSLLCRCRRAHCASARAATPAAWHGMHATPALASAAEARSATLATARCK
jgi:hypothetical protein